MFTQTGIFYLRTVAGTPVASAREKGPPRASTSQGTCESAMKADRTMDRYVHDERDPLGAWVDWYVSAEHRDEPGTGCPVAALIGDVNRCNDHIRDGYDALVDRYIGVVAGMLGGGDDARRQAIMAVSALVGSLVLARAVNDDTHSKEILGTVREALRHQPGAIQ